MRRLILMRHGKAEGPTGQGDHVRPLSTRGRAEALEAGRRMAGLFRPEAVLVSDSARTRETLDSAEPALPSGLSRRITRDIYGATAKTILDAIRATPAEVETLLVIGHNPGIGDLARSLAAEGEAGDLARIATRFPTSCFAVLDLAIADWRSAGAPGRLTFLLPADERSGA